MDFSERLNVRIDDDIRIEIQEIIKQNPDRFTSESDFVRISVFLIIKSIKDNRVIKNGKLLQ